MGKASGIDVLQSISGLGLVLRASLKDPTNVALATGTTTLALLELQDDGTFKTFDWYTNTFKATGMTATSVSPAGDKSIATMVHQQRLGPNAGSDGFVDTGIWTKVAATVTGFTVGGIYIMQVTNTGAGTPQQERAFQYGGVEGDLTVTTGGVKLSSNGLDAITVTEPSGAIGTWTFREMFVMLFRRMFGKVAVTGADLKVYKADNSTVGTTQVLSDDGTTQTQGSAT
jgi:hypothetical protein